MLVTGEPVLGVCLLVLSQGAGRVDAAGATRGQETREQGGREQGGNHNGESRWTDGLHPLYQMLEYATCCQSSKYAYANADGNHSQALPEDEPHHIVGASSERNANAEFRNALAGQVRQHSVDADACEQQSQQGKYGEQQQEEALAGDRIAYKLLHGADIIERLIAGCSTQFAPQWLNQA